MGRMDGKVALITGAARGQGRSHAVRLAEEGADIIAVDICDNIDSVPFSMGMSWELSDEQWQDVIDVNLTGVWRTIKAVMPTLIDQGTGGSIIITSSMAGEMGLAGISHYTAAKHAVMGLMRSLVNEVSQYGIRVNCVNPTTVNTDMIHNDAFYQYCQASTGEEMGAFFQTLHTLPVPWVEPIDISNAVLFLASDESRYVTGLPLWVDAGLGTKVGPG